MKLKNLELHVQMMEETLAKMKMLTKEVEAMDDQVDTVRMELGNEQGKRRPQPVG